MRDPHEEVKRPEPGRQPGLIGLAEIKVMQIDGVGGWAS